MHNLPILSGASAGDAYTWATRRAFLRRSAASLGSLALATLLNRNATAVVNGRVQPAALDARCIAPRAKRVIYLYMSGGPSQLETFDYKAKLGEMDGQPMPESLTKGQSIAQLQNSDRLVCSGPKHTFSRYGQSGQEISSILPHLAGVADDLCIIRSMQTEAINHDPALMFMNTGSAIPGRPSVGSWALYGLGSECANLPGFVVLRSSGKFGIGGPIPARLWSSGFLSSRFQGVEFRGQGDAVLYASNPPGVTCEQQADVIAATNTMNRIEDEIVADPEIAARISQYEVAFRMQASVPELIDVSDEPQHILDLYGTKGADGSFGSNCLLARRLAERGVRFVQLYHRDWDHHSRIKSDSAGTAQEVDQGAAALIADLKQRGMLDETLVIWGGEFGRTPMAQGTGRDHHIKGFSIFLAGGGVRGGMNYGETDELGYNVAKDPVHVHDLHATMLHLLGIDHQLLTYRVQGRDFRLTDVAGHVVSKILA